MLHVTRQVEHANACVKSPSRPIPSLLFQFFLLFSKIYHYLDIFLMNTLTTEERKFIMDRLKKAFNDGHWRAELIRTQADQNDCYQCADCQDRFSYTEIQVDHIEPVINPITGFTSWDDFIERQFTHQLEILCKQCHKYKSSQENVLRRQRAIQPAPATPAPRQVSLELLKQLRTLAQAQNLHHVDLIERILSDYIQNYHPPL